MNVHLLVALDDARFDPGKLHVEYEGLDARGYLISREHRASGHLLARIDERFGGSGAVTANGGGAWWLEGDGALAGYAAYDTSAATRALARSASENDAALVAPLELTEDARSAEAGGPLARAAMFALRERGFRRALVTNVPEDEAEWYARETGAYALTTAQPPAPKNARTVVMASGNGSNFESIVAASQANEVPLEIAALVTNRADAGARERARRLGVPEGVVERGGDSRATYDVRLLETVAALRPDLVLLLGWMHVLSADFVAAFSEMLNLHPAYLPLDLTADTVVLPDGSQQPAFRGARAVDDALTQGARWLGASVHRVRLEVDRGEILARAPLARNEGETREELDDRLHVLERRTTVAALRHWSLLRADQ